MTTSVNTTLFFIGLAVGGGVAILGGVIEYLLHLRRNREPRFGVPGCLVYAVGGLILAGIAAIITSLVITGRISPALFMGAGVLIGFYGGFIILVGLWFLFDSRHRQTVELDNSLSSDQTLP
jgi:hypothetical protein